jgi:hypothetical protein
MRIIARQARAFVLLAAAAACAWPAAAADKKRPARSVAEVREELRLQALERYTSESDKALETCKRDNFGEACTAAQKRVEQLRLEVEKLTPDDGYGVGNAPLGK